MGGASDQGVARSKTDDSTVCSKINAASTSLRDYGST